MDEKVLMVIGAAAAVTVAGRGVRPLAKVLMRGLVAANEATTAGRRGLEELYAEAKAERASSSASPSAVGAPDASTAPATATARAVG